MLCLGKLVLVSALIVPSAFTFIILSFGENVSIPL